MERPLVAIGTSVEVGLGLTDVEEVKTDVEMIDKLEDDASLDKEVVDEAKVGVGVGVAVEVVSVISVCSVKDVLRRTVQVEHQSG
jgi:hypothetical protein